MPRPKPLHRKRYVLHAPERPLLLLHYEQRRLLHHPEQLLPAALRVRPGLESVRPGKHRAQVDPHHTDKYHNSDDYDNPDDDDDADHDDNPDDDDDYNPGDHDDNGYFDCSRVAARRGGDFGRAGTEVSSGRHLLFPG